MLQRNIHAQFEHTLIRAIETLYIDHAKQDAVIAHRCYYGTNENINDTPIMGLSIEMVLSLIEHAPTYTTSQIAFQIANLHCSAYDAILVQEYWKHLCGLAFSYGRLLEKLYPVFLVAFGQFDSLQSQDLRNDYNGQTFETAQDWMIAAIQRKWGEIIVNAQYWQFAEIGRIQERRALKVVNQ